MSRRMKNTLRSLITALAMAILCSTAAFADNTDITRFVKDTDVNGLAIGGMTVEEAELLLGNASSGSYKLTVKRNDGKADIITGPEIGYAAIVPEGLQAILDQQNAAGRVSGPHAQNSHKMQMTGTFDDAAMTAKIKTLSGVIDTDIVPTIDAHISTYQEGQPFTIIPQIQGNDLDLDKTLYVLKGAASMGITEINLADWDCYKTPKITSDDAQLKQLCVTMNQCKDMTITYTFGENTAVLAGPVICTWLTGLDNGQIDVNADMAAAYIAALALQYDTAGAARVFHTAGGADVSLAGPYGWKIDQPAETQALIAMIRTGQTQLREPQYVQSAAGRTASDWGNTYVEIDLTGQHVYMYQDGAQIWDAPCVTGNISKNYTTPVGIYSLAYKQEDRVLRGAKQSDGTYEYESHVNYWMPFNGGIGLHDAEWRSKFGGTIYQYGGSHGCINLPPAAAKVLYGLVYKDIPVLCYN